MCCCNLLSIKENFNKLKINKLGYWACFVICEFEWLFFTTVHKKLTKKYVWTTAHYAKKKTNNSLLYLFRTILKYTNSSF